MENKKLIDLYKYWMETGLLHEKGLCNSVPDKYCDDLLLFAPTKKEENALLQKGLSTSFWGSGLLIRDTIYKRMYDFTPLRQTITLFIAAMCDEL